MSDAQTSFGRFVLACLLVVATLGFGLAGLCGGVFTLAALPDLFSKGPENYSAAMLVISLPSLLIGGGLTWLCVRKLAQMLSKRRE